MAQATLHFSSTAVQTSTCVILLLGISLISHFLSNRITFQGFTMRGIRMTSWPRICVVALLVLSWIFLIAVTVLTYGVGMTTSLGACIGGNMICITFYGLSKVFVYLFLVERVHIVWASRRGLYERKRSKLYVFCILSVIIYGVIMALVVRGRVSYLRASDGECIIGITSTYTSVLLAFDVYITFFLTGLFLFPLVRRKLASRTLRAAAKRALIGSSIALVVSTVNMGLLAKGHGEQKHVLCIMLCSLDIIINATSLYYVTSPLEDAKADTFEDHRDLPAPPVPLVVQIRHTHTTNLLSVDCASLDVELQQKRRADPEPKDDDSLAYPSPTHYPTCGTRSDIMRFS